jgi:hypothetical protein
MSISSACSFFSIETTLQTSTRSSSDASAGSKCSAGAAGAPLHYNIAMVGTRLVTNTLVGNALPALLPGWLWRVAKLVMAWAYFLKE